MRFASSSIVTYGNVRDALLVCKLLFIVVVTEILNIYGVCMKNRTELRSSSSLTDFFGDCGVRNEHAIYKLAGTAAAAFLINISAALSDELSFLHTRNTVVILPAAAEVFVQIAVFLRVRRSK